MKRVFLEQEFLFSKEVFPFQGSAKNYTYPAPGDVPDEIDLSPTKGGELALRFIYGDREEAGEEETALDAQTEFPIHVKLGRYSGKLMSLRTSAGTEVVPAIAERLRTAAPFQKQKNQELNFLLLSNILREKQGELQFTV